jgi:hypothetical protein
VRADDGDEADVGQKEDERGMGWATLPDMADVAI